MIVVYCDGLCEPLNPGGTATYGWVAYRDGQKLREDCAMVCSGPEATNNVAEYSAVIFALKWLLENGRESEKIVVCSDSQLCIYQLTGDYAVRSGRIRPLYEQARALARKFKFLEFRWVPREENKEADALSRKAYAGAAKSSREEKANALLKNVERLDCTQYRVRSQNGSRTYLVDTSVPACTCPDFLGRCLKAGIKCKHILAAEKAAE
ncbi:MAG: reverse transcriptase-like protein [Dehalococcoidia bacterium]|nr:MAG: reverse transcriptase-like protein [Dehalococcoidia bacterium]